MGVGYKHNFLCTSDDCFAEDPNGWKKILPGTRQWHVLKMKNSNSSGSYIDKTCSCHKLIIMPFWVGMLSLSLGHKQWVSTDEVIMIFEKISNHKSKIIILFVILDKRQLLFELLAGPVTSVRNSSKKNGTGIDSLYIAFFPFANFHIMQQHKLIIQKGLILSSSDCRKNENVYFQYIFATS